MLTFNDFPEATEGHANSGIKRSYIFGGRDP